MGNFRKARVGDKVWSWRFGWGIITAIYPDQGPYPIHVRISGRVALYTYEGYYSTDDVRPDLFWDEIKFNEPPPPKRKRKVRIERWLVVHQAHKSFGDGFVIQFFLSEPDRLAKEVHRWKQEIEFEVDEE